MNQTTSEPAAPSAPPTAPKLTPLLMRLGDALGTVEADDQAAHDARTTGTPRGPITGLKEVDRELSGALSIGTNILLGNTGAGKTAFALQVAASCQFPALFVTCEMAPAELLRRHTARVTGTYLGRLKSGELHPADVVNLTRRGIEAAPLVYFADVTRGAPPPGYLRECAEIVRGQAGRLLIVVDSLHSWARRAILGASEYDVLGAALDELQALAHVTQSPLLVVSERNRAGMGAGGVNSGAGHRGIEYGAETVLDLQRADNAKEDGAGEVEVTLKFAKNRHGAAGKTIALKFNGALQRFAEAKE